MVPAIKAQGAAKLGARTKAKIAENIGGIKAGIETPPPPCGSGVTLAKNLETISLEQ